MNFTVLMGNLTADPEVRASQSGMTIARYTLAVQRKGKDKGADFIRCVALDKAGDFASRYLHKGTKIGVIGSIRTDSYEDHNTGKKVYTTEVNVREHYFCESRSDAQNATENAQNGYRQGNAQPQMNEGFMAIPDGQNGLPFN